MPDRDAIEQVIVALVETGSPDYSKRAGATLDQMSSFAKAGDLESVSLAFLAYAKLVPGDAQRVREAVPVKIENQYWYLHQKLAATAIQAWQAANPDWRDAIITALPTPALFEQTIRDMARAIARLEAGST